MLEGTVVIRDCGCWIIRSYGSNNILRFSACGGHIALTLDELLEFVYLDKVGSVSAPTETEAQLWLT